jgi:hypothetical protein
MIRLLRPPAVGDNGAMEAEPPKADSPKRKRRRFQFSLRTLLIGVTLLAVPCAYTGWQEKIISERREVVATHGIIRSWYIPIVRYDSTPEHPLPRPLAPWPLRWLGEDGFARIVAKDRETDDEVANLKRLFPEAEIWRGGKRL